MKSEDWVGHRTGRLTIEAFEGIKTFGRGRACYFRFRCDCGNSFVAQKSNILGKREDCGCSKPVAYTSPPGSWAHPLHKTWWAMMDRCENPKNKSFKDYGARGISVCTRWKFGADGLTGFECFLADMGPRPDGFTIERVMGHLNYEPGNCVWIAKGDQSKNRRTVRLVRINEQVKTIPDWCADYKLNYWTAIRRIARGWPPDKAITTPIRGAA
jgi:hypothetical protein